MDSSRFGIQSNRRDFSGESRKRPLPPDDDDDGLHESREEQANIAFEEWKKNNRKEKSVMPKFSTNAENTRVVLSRKGKWPKISRLERIAARLRYIDDATGDIQTMVLKTIAATPSCAAASDSKTTMFTVFTGTGGGLDNNGDIPKMFPIAVNVDPVSSIAGMRKKSQKIYVKSCHLEFDLSTTAAGDAEILFYECICLRDHGNGEINYTSSDTFQDDWIARMPSGLGTTTGLTALVKTHYLNSPYFWHEFGAYWKITKQSKFIVPAGKSIKFEKHINVCKMIDADYMEGNDFFRHLSRLYIFTVRGVFIGTGSAGGIGVPVAGVNCYGTYKFTTRNVDTPTFTTSATEAS